MGEGELLPVLIGAAVVGLVAVILILRRSRHAMEEVQGDRQYAASTEGETRCPACGMGNLSTDEQCVACGAKLR